MQAHERLSLSINQAYEAVHSARAGILTTSLAIFVGMLVAVYFAGE